VTIETNGGAACAFAAASPHCALLCARGVTQLKCAQRTTRGFGGRQPLDAVDTYFVGRRKRSLHGVCSTRWNTWNTHSDSAALAAERPVPLQASDRSGSDGRAEKREAAVLTIEFSIRTPPTTRTHRGVGQVGDAAPIGACSRFSAVGAGRRRQLPWHDLADSGRCGSRRW
jgi:hypothetical protein